MDGLVWRLRPEKLVLVLVTVPVEPAALDRTAPERSRRFGRWGCVLSVRFFIFLFGLRLEYTPPAPNNLEHTPHW